MPHATVPSVPVVFAAEFQTVVVGDEDSVAVEAGSVHRAVVFSRQLQYHFVYAEPVDLSPTVCAPDSTLCVIQAWRGDLVVGCYKFVEVVVDEQLAWSEARQIDAAAVVAVAATEAAC